MRLIAKSPTPAVRAEIRPGIWLDSRLALWFADERLLVLADLHWGYAASHRARGNLLPEWGDEDMEARLRSLIFDYSPSEMIWLGDIVHAAEGSARVERYLRETPVPTTVLAGNHDRRWRGASDRTALRGRFFFYHGDREECPPAGSVAVIGHHHPAVAWSDGAGGNVKLPALLVSSSRIVLPAFSPWASGTDYRTLAEADGEIWAISSKRIFAVTRPGVASVLV